MLLHVSIHRSSSGSTYCSLLKLYVKRLILLLQSAMQPFWVLACSTIVEYSQQEGFYRVPLPAARQNPNLEDQWLERSNSRHQVFPMSETTWANPSSGRWNYGREMAENFAESGDFHTTFGFFYMPQNLWHGTDGFTSPLKEGVLRIFCLKNPMASAGFEPTNTGTRGQHAYL